MLYLLPLKSSSLSKPIQPCSREDDTRHILHRSHLWAFQKKLPSGPSRSSGFGHHHGSTKLPANCSIHVAIHSDHDSSSTKKVVKHRFAPGVTERLSGESPAMSLAASLVQEPMHWRHRLAPSWMQGRQLANLPVRHCAFWPPRAASLCVRC